MALIQMVLALVVLSILYRRMIRKEVPSPIGAAQAVVPVVLGVFSTFLSFVFFLGIAYLLKYMGVNNEGLPLVLRSIIASILAAGIPEEVAKLLMILLTLAIFRKKVRNVYEYILIGAAVGFGFTLFEEFLYGSGGAVDAIGRLVTVAAHMVFGVIMAKHLGQGAYQKLHGEGSAAGENAKAFFIPFAIHVLYDAFTANNRLLTSENDYVLLIGTALGIASVVVLFIVQIKVLKDTRRDAEKYCAMELNRQPHH